MLRTPVRALLLAAILSVLVAACGTSGGDDAADTTAAKSGSTTTEAPADTTATTAATERDPTETTETTETTVAQEPADEDICVPLKVLSDYDIESAKLVNAGDWAAMQAFFVDHTESVLAAYDDAIAMDTEVTEDLQALRSVTETTAATASEASDLMDFSAKLLAQPGIMAAGASGIALNDFAQEHCGFSTGGNGQ